MKKKKKGSKLRTNHNRLRIPPGKSVKNPIFIHPLKALESLLEYQFQERLSALLESIIRKNEPKIFADNTKSISQLNRPKTSKVTREEVFDIIERAHARIYDLNAMNVQSPALQEIIENGLVELDEISELSQSGLNEEYLKARNFLNDPTSTIEGAKEWEFKHKVSFYKGAFGGQWKEGDLRYDPSRIDADLASIVFKNYRKLSSVYRSVILQYGSENLIEEMYVTQERGQDSFEYGKELMLKLQHEPNEFWDDTASESQKPISGRREYDDDDDWI